MRACIAILLLPLLTAPSASDGPHVRLEGRLVWSFTDETAPFVFGRITDVAADDRGDVYVVDAQLSQVVVLSAEGEFRRTIGRDGEGPGGLARPYFVLLHDEDVLVFERYPGTVNRFSSDGTWAARIPVSTDAEERVGVGRPFHGPGGLVVHGTARGRRGGEGYTRPFVARLGDEGVVARTFVAVESPYDPTHIDSREAERHLVSDRVAVDERGWVFIGPERHAYRITVADTGGVSAGEIRRPLPPRRRSADELARWEAAKPTGFPGTITLDAFDATIDRLESHGGSLWVLTAYGRYEPSEGAFQTWERYDPRDDYRQVSAPDAIVDVVLDAEWQRDRMFFLTEDRVVLVRNHEYTMSDTESDPDGERAIECYDLVAD